MLPHVEKTSYDIGIKRDTKIVDKIKADQTHKDIKQAYITIQYDIAKLKVLQKQAEGKLINDRFNVDIKKKINFYQYEIALLRVQQKDLEGKLNKSRFNIKKLTDEIELLKGRFFSARESGI